MPHAPVQLDYATPDPAHPLRELLILSAPTVAQMMSYTLMQFIDTWMLAKVGVNEATAVGNSGLLAFSIISLGMGVLWIVNALVSQHFGRKDYPACGQYLWQGIWFSLVFSILLLPLAPVAEKGFAFFGHEPALARMEGQYLRIIIALSVVKLIGTTFGQFLLAVNRPGMVLVSTVCGVSVNAVVAWGVILGNLGMPRMGVVGAAWAQNIGVAVETLVLILFVIFSGIRSAYNVTDWKPWWGKMKTLLTVGIPSGVQVVADVLAWAMFGVWVMGTLGTVAMAGNTFMIRYMTVSFMPAFGLSTAVTALVGRYIGMGRPDLAAQRTHLAFAITAIYMVSCGLGFFFFRDALMRQFTDQPDILAVGSMLLIFAAVYQFFDALYIIYNGALRGAGDTFVPAVATFGLCWGITVLGGYAVAIKFPQLGAAGPWLAATLYGIILGIFIYWRFARGRWKQIHLDQPSNPTQSSATIPRDEH